MGPGPLALGLCLEDSPATMSRRWGAPRAARPPPQTGHPWVHRSVRQPGNDYSSAVQRCLSADQSVRGMNRASHDWGKASAATIATAARHPSKNSGPVVRKGHVADRRNGTTTHRCTRHRIQTLLRVESHSGEVRPVATRCHVQLRRVARAGDRQAQGRRRPVSCGAD